MCKGVPTCARCAKCAICGNGPKTQRVPRGQTYGPNGLVLQTTYVINLPLYVPKLDQFICGNCSEECTKCHNPVITRSSPWIAVPNRCAIEGGKLYCSMCCTKCDCGVQFCNGNHILCKHCNVRIVPTPGGVFNNEDPLRCVKLSKTDGTTCMYHLGCVVSLVKTAKPPKDKTAAETYFRVTADGQIKHKTEIPCAVCKTRSKGDGATWRLGPEQNGMFSMYHKSCYASKAAELKPAPMKKRGSSSSASSSGKPKKRVRIQEP